MRYLLLCLVMMLSACEVVFLPDTSLPDRTIVVHEQPHTGAVYVDNHQQCHLDPPFYYEAEWCDYVAHDVYCTYYVGHGCYEEWMHDSWCGWSFVDDWCVY